MQPGQISRVVLTFWLIEIETVNIEIFRTWEFDLDKFDPAQQFFIVAFFFLKNIFFRLKLRMFALLNK